MKSTMKSKMRSSKPATFASAGGNKMSGKNSVGPQKPGTSGSAGQKSNPPVLKGGGKKMAGFTPASPSKKM